MVATSGHPKGREPPNHCCAPGKRDLGMKWAYSRCEACWWLPRSPCGWWQPGNEGLKVSPSPSALSVLTLGCSLQGLESWEGLVVSFLHVNSVFFLDRYTSFLTKRSLFSKYQPFPEKQTQFCQPTTQLR